MRVTSLVAFAVVALAAGYFIFLTPDWAVDLYHQATGFGAATTPAEAVDKFLKCTQKRDYKTAARFCTGDYADLLKKSHPLANELGVILDGINDYMKGKGLATDKCVIYMHQIDPFPKNIKVSGSPKARDDSAAVAAFEMDALPLSGTKVYNLWELERELSGMDPGILNMVLVPFNLRQGKTVDVVKDGEGWKLKFIVTPQHVKAVDYYLLNVKAYSTGLAVFRREVTNDRYASKQDFERELISVFAKAKG